jgi:hypothetical protein
MKKPEKKPKPRKRTANLKDLTAKDAAKVKGGLNPQPDPPMIGDHKTGFLKITNPTINPSSIINPTLKY